MQPTNRIANVLGGCAAQWNNQHFDLAKLTFAMDVPSDPTYHTPVLLKDVIELLRPTAGHTVVDCTVGTGGHSLSILPHLLPTGRVIALDHDVQALEMAQQRLAEFAPQLTFAQDNFRHLPELLSRVGVERVQGLLADLGISSLHVDRAERGFSFSKEGPLDMRMDVRQTTTAASLVHRLSERDLAHVLEVYGEERWARRIAKRIVMARMMQPIETTTQLARIVADAVPQHSASRHLHPATRTFLALRIAVNDELKALEALVAVLPDLLEVGGRAVIISFHSLEDRLVKRAFQHGAQQGIFRLLTKKPLRASEQEVRDNPRSRSAKLRAVERI